MKSKNIISAFSAVAITAITLTACNNNSAITVISREDGSGTRSAFTELMEITVDNIDNTVATAEISNSTSVVIQSVISNINAIGYISLGSLGEEVKVVSVDGVAPTIENVKNGNYKISRPFNIVTNADISELAADFVTFIMSEEGQDIVEEKGYISASYNSEYAPAGLKGTIVVAGSTSVAPVMEVLADRYKELNEGVTIEIQQTGSSAGITSAIEGACDIGMASRDVKESEIAEGLISTVIALDGIAVIVNSENTIDDLSSEEIKAIYTGDIRDWAEIK